MSTDPTREELESEVVDLLHGNRYDPAILPRLELFVDYQVSQNFYDVDTNLAVLKLYQFHPTTYNASTVSKILIKALMATPSSDFLTCLYLIPEKRQVNEPIPVISRLANMLERGNFMEFWRESGACKDLLESVPGSMDAFRELMLDVIGRTYTTVELKTLGQTLALNDPDVITSMSGRGWNIKDDVVHIPPNEENQPCEPSLDEHLSFKQVASRML